MKKLLWSMLVMLAMCSPLAFAVSTTASFDTDTKLMLHMDGTDASTTFTDSSSGGKTVTAVADAQIDTAQKVFGTASGLFDGTGDFLSVPDSADWSFGTGDFTIDFRVRFNSLPGVGILAMFVSQLGAVGNWSWSVQTYNNAGTYQLYFQTSNDGTTLVNYGPYNWTPSTNTWYHISVVRSGNNLYTRVDGTQVGSTADVTALNFFDSTNPLKVGCHGADGIEFSLLDGWIDELRVVKGTAVWTSNFAPPSVAYRAKRLVIATS